MILLLITTLLSSSLCSLSSSVPRQFHVVKEPKNWTEAQQYCREEFTDLATIDNMAEMEEVKSLMQREGVAWIGLKQGSSSKWQWSLADRDFYRDNEAEFRNWDTGEPQNHDEQCVTMNGNGKWSDAKCSHICPFICYDGRNSTHPYVLVNEKKNWTDAQRYCREKHTDLASVRNQTENDQMKEVSGGQEVWIGLFRDAWEWSDGSSSSFRYWDKGEPNYGSSATEFCTEMYESNGLWNDQDCQHKRNFICYKDAPKQVKRRQIVKVEFQVDPQVNINDPAMQQVFLQQIQQRLREKGMPADAKLTWRKQLDGQIFHEKEDETEEGRKRNKRDKL